MDCRSFTAMSSNRRVGQGLLIAVAILGLVPASHAAIEKERDPVTLTVVAVNPSETKTQVVPVRIDLPQEVTPKDVLEAGELKLEYDEDRKVYYVSKDDVALNPKETRVFEVTLRDLWFVPQKEVDSLRDYTKLVMGRLEKSDYARTAKGMADSILERLQGIETEENDETISRKTRIGNYRHHRQTLAEIKEDLARMEKLMSFTGGVPVPEMMQESALKSDAPSTTTTWMVIFLILVFVGMLAGLFFFTWHRRGQVTQDLAMVRKVAFPGSDAAGVGSSPEGNGQSAAPRR